MEYLFILRFKGPLRFSMFGTRLSFKQFWFGLFLNGLRDIGCRAPFWKPCTITTTLLLLLRILLPFLQPHRHRCAYAAKPVVLVCWALRWEYLKSLKVKSCNWSFFGGQSPPPETWILAKGAGRNLLQCFAHFVVVRKRCPIVM